MENEWEITMQEGDALGCEASMGGYEGSMQQLLQQRPLRLLLLPLPLLLLPLPQLLQPLPPRGGPHRIFCAAGQAYGNPLPSVSDGWWA